MDSLVLQRVQTGWAPPTLALLAAVTAGVVAQGGFYLPGRILVTALALIALALAGHRFELRPLWLAAAAIAAWALLRAVTAGGLADAAGICLALLTLVAGVVVGRGARATDLAAGLTGLGALVAITAWAGVAWRIERWSVLVESTLWRGASALTYANAAAAILAACALLALALCTARPSKVQSLLLYLTISGLGATLSRAGALAFALGTAVFLVFGPRRAALRHLIPAALGAAVATAALVPSFPATASPRPLIALAGLAAGAVIALLHPWFALGLSVLGALLVDRSTLDKVLDRRFTLDSRGRSGALHSALATAREHPLLGSGPGQARYLWFDYKGDLVVSRWVHNEYLQWLVDLGAVGLVGLLALIAALAVLMRRGYARNPLWAGAVAAIAALAVHSAFDFLWELAVVPLLIGALTGMAAQPRGEEPAVSINGEVPQ
ncbi:O-antigen ligase family protein [Dactylosporangium sp. CS-033363]|uniref:O-antigen ligase family protein n=1 Tax=Dactylosporangium sp. CS-033363 TaxID=3239935 RepID=UPI003D8CC1A8